MPLYGLNCFNKTAAILFKNNSNVKFTIVP